ncbi:MAG: hypothetical protein P4N60_13375 [Verrucomicrobiae bacterium]|nr:hypothetical protein [Verrucomicrobiae bacterium]
MKTGGTSLKGFVVLALGFFLAGAVRADDATPGFRGDGLCRFALNQYFLPKVNEDKINLIVADLLRRHEEAFGFTASPNLRVRIRIFGTFEGYRSFALTNHNGFEHESLSISNLAGYFSPRDNEVVTWRQRDPTYLANNILHECSHAIMHQQFRELPIWLDEGCAVYFSFPVYMRDAHDDLILRSRWYELRKWQREGALPDLRKFLSISPQEFRRQDPKMTYPVSWSIFQLLMSTPENRRALNALVAEFQKPAAKPPEAAQLLDKFYPGGLARMDKDWRNWIARGAVNVLGMP